MANIFKASNGTWAYKATIGTGANRSQPYKSGFKTKREAKQAAAKVESTLDSGVDIYSQKQPFADFFESWITTYKIGKYTDVTDNWYKMVARYIREFFKDTPIGQIHRQDYQKFMDYLGETPRGVRQKALAHSTIVRVNSYISATMQDAIDEGAVTLDFTRRVHIGGRAGKPASKKYVSAGDLEKIIARASQNADMNHISNFIIITQAYTGLRFEEALGITWDRIDWTGGRIKIDRSWQYRNGKQHHNFGPLKNNSSYRTIPVPKALLVSLKKLQTEQLDFYAKRDYTDPDNLCFRNKLFRVIGNNAINDTLKRHCEAIGCNLITSHGLRHTHGSLLLYKGVELLSISKRLGHENMQTTIDTYTHELAEMKARDDDKIVGILDCLIPTVPRDTAINVK